LRKGIGGLKKTNLKDWQAMKDGYSLVI